MSDEREYEVITFDCYGTLVDWESGITDALTALASRAGVTMDPGAALAVYMEIEPAVEAEAFACYSAVLTETAHRVAKRLGWSIAPQDSAFLPDSLPEWPVFGDTRAGLRRLAEAGYRLGILSNVDEDLLAATRRALDAPFETDLIVTAQAVGSYKPAHAHFLEARRRIGDSGWLHAAQSWVHDVVPAVELGIPVAWVNRNRENRRNGLRPDLEVNSVSGLADILT
jgi:2-haloalkanoic acid dehalogenase type II